VLLAAGAPASGAPRADALAFALPDASGHVVSLADFRGAPVVVFFFRGFWCASCVEQLVRLERLKAADLRDVPVVAISPDGPSAILRGLASVAKDRGVSLTHRFLADEGAVFRERYGLGASGASRPPAMLLLDASGLATWRFGESHYETSSFDAPLREALARLPKSPPPR
jgi:peroxiredoxin